MRVLFSSTSGYGHLYPMLPLAKAFVAQGHDVLWATGATDIVRRAGIDTAPSGLSGSQLHDGLRALGALAAEVAPPSRAGFVYPRMFGTLLAAPMLTDLLPLASAWQPDLLIHEAGELASPLVGALLDRPSLTHAFGSAVPEAFVAEAGERLAPMWAAHGREIPPHAGCFLAPYLDICPPSVQSVSTQHIAHVLPLRPVADTGGQSRADAPDEDGRPLIYVTLGTIHNRAAFLRPMVEALAALPARLMVTVGQDGDPAVLGSQPPHVRVERWVDQPSVLRHCSVVVSHAGSGTFLGALAQGRPQLCLPQAADQFRNAEAGVRTGAALALPPGCGVDEVRAAAERLLSESAFRKAAARVAAEIEAMPSPDDVVRAIAEWRSAG